MCDAGARMCCSLTAAAERLGSRAPRLLGALRARRRPAAHFCRHVAGHGASLSEVSSSSQTAHIATLSQGTYAQNPQLLSGLVRRIVYQVRCFFAAAPLPSLNAFPTVCRPQLDSTTSSSARLPASRLLPLLYVRPHPLCARVCAYTTPQLLEMHCSPFGCIIVDALHA